jgi:arginine deiminase
MNTHNDVMMDRMEAEIDRLMVALEAQTSEHAVTQELLVATEQMSETRREMLADSFDNVTALCKERDRMRTLLREVCDMYERGNMLGGGLGVHDLTLVPLTSTWYLRAKGELK